MKTGQYLQQGDVIIEKVDYDITGEKLDHVTLAVGEATGHHHSLVQGLGTLIMMNEVMHLNVESEFALLKHQEHFPVKIPKGNYKIKIVQEYDHFEEEAKRVAD